MLRSACCRPTNRALPAPMRAGAAAVAEFAIVAPVFFLMVIGFIEFGRALMVQQVLINASRVGARMATTTGATTSAVQSAVEAYTTGVAVPHVAVSVSPNPATADRWHGDDRYERTVAFSDVSWMTSRLVLRVVKRLRPTSQMRKEGFE